jgi:NAD(P)-dependent dehydrogenase (short-subunit alcohol dehydrogenase family)
MNDFENAVALVVGGASGMGLSVAKALGALGCHIVIADCHQERLTEAQGLLESQGIPCRALVCDVTSDALVTESVEQAVAWRGRLDIAMITAGMSLMGPPHAIPIDDWQAIMDVNVIGTVRVCNAVMPHLMQREKASLVITGSVAGKMAYTDTAAPYIASKHAVNGYAASLAIFARKHGVQVTCLSPGFVTTNMGDNARFAGTDDPGAWYDVPEFMNRTVMDSDSVAREVINAIRDKKFDLYSAPALKEVVLQWQQDIDRAIEVQSR